MEMVQQDLVDEVGGDASGDRESPGDRDQGSAESTIDRPGVYRIKRGERSQTIAANLAPAESLTEPLGEDELERAGVVLGKPVSAAAAESRQRQLRDIELESQQRLWHWLLIAVLGLLAAETLLGGLLGRTQGRQTAKVQ